MSNEITVIEAASAHMVVSIDDIKRGLNDLRKVVNEVMVQDTDYGVIPGTPKPTLLQPGGQKLLDIYGYMPRSHVVSRVEDWDKGFFAYEVHTDLVHRATGRTYESVGIGHCNSREDKYRWRQADRKCPSCGKPTIIKGREEYGGGWLCFNKKGGCGAKFAAKAPEIVSQEVGRIENPDPYSLVNTILKMADKRSLVAAALKISRSSDLFTQDIEDMPGYYNVPAEPNPKPDSPPVTSSRVKLVPQEEPKPEEPAIVTGPGITQPTPPEEPQRHPEEPKGSTPLTQETKSLVFKSVGLYNKKKGSGKASVIILTHVPDARPVDKWTEEEARAIVIDLQAGIGG